MSLTIHSWSEESVVSPLDVSPVPGRAPITVGRRSSEDYEDDPWISPDGHTLYFSRGSDAATQLSLFIATR